MYFFPGEIRKPPVKHAASNRLKGAFDFDMKDGEGVIEFLRETEGSVIAVLVYPKDDTLKVSLRSKDFRYPVGPVARSLNGGGHEMASGITARNISADELCAALKNKIGELLQV